jgi:4-amino-4-deoxy-L-arabinose transferase-like glycosyltransferase
MPTAPPTGLDPRKHHKRVRKFERHVVEEIELADTAAMRAVAKRARFAELRSAASWIGLWLLLTGAGLFARGPWPSDETRLLGIAWEMWARGNLLVPYLNGQPQLQPPLFSWLIHLGWFVGGVSEIWARLVPALGALASLFVVQRLARRLWPDEDELARYAPLLLLGTFAFALMAGVVLPDMWLLCFVLIALWSLSIQWRSRDHRVWLLTALGLSGGMLTSGPIALAYVLPLALLAPVWVRAPRPQWNHWYGDLTKATVLALTVFGLWLAGVARSDGWAEVVRWLSHTWKGSALEWFPAQQPWWWYAAILPLVLLPWSVLPLAWMRLWHIRREPLDGGFVLCLLWLVLPLLWLTLVPVKQAHYLLPLLPAGVLLTTRLLLAKEIRNVHEDKGFAGMAFPLILLGGLLMVLPRLPQVEYLPAILWQQSPLVGMAVMAVGIATAWLPIKDTRRRAFDIAALVVSLVVFVLLGIGSQFNSLYPVPEVARVIADAQRAGRPVAHIGEYRGEFHFAGRLRAPLAIIDAARERGRVDTWAAANPNGVIVTYSDRWQPRFLAGNAPLFETPFRGEQLRIVGVSQLVLAPAPAN